jgi:hypothetical protein
LRPLPGGRFKGLRTDETWLDTVRLARDCGTVAELYPPGIDHLYELPHTLFDAIQQALRFLDFEELPKDERPPKSIWEDTEAMKEHFEAVEARRKEKVSGNDIEDPVENEAAKDLLVG